jgi:hypothetical protein
MVVGGLLRGACWVRMMVWGEDGGGSSHRGQGTRRSVVGGVGCRRERCV